MKNNKPFNEPGDRFDRSLDSPRYPGSISDRCISLEDRRRLTLIVNSGMACWYFRYRGIDGAMQDAGL